LELKNKFFTYIKKRVLKPSFFLLILFFGCSLKNDYIPDVKVYSNLIVYNNNFKSFSSISILDTTIIIDTISLSTDIIISSFASNSITFLSPSKDTILSKGNKKITGFYSTGKEKYNTPPQEGYFDMEIPMKENWYFIKTFDNRYLRVYVKEVCQESLLFDLELLNDTSLIFQ